jgi:hypothetical protein
VEIKPDFTAIDSATDNIVNTLFSASLKQQVLSTPPPSLPQLVVPATEAEEPISMPTTTIASAVEKQTPTPHHQVLMPSPFKGVSLRVTPPAIPKVPTHSAGSALQATLVQAIKQSEAPVKVALPLKVAHTLLATTAKQTEDFRTVTQRFSNKKFQGSY